MRTSCVLHVSFTVCNFSPWRDIKLSTVSALHYELLVSKKSIDRNSGKKPTQHHRQNRDCCCSLTILNVPIPMILLGKSYQLLW